MANALYANGRNEFLIGSIDWVNDSINVVLVDTADYNVDLSNHTSLADIPVAARIATASLESKTAVGGVADGGDVTFSTVTGDEAEALIIYKNTGVEGTSTLIAYIDTASGLPVLPNTGDIIVQWDSGPNKIFRL